MEILKKKNKINSGTFKKGHVVSVETREKLSVSKKGIMPKNMKIVGWNLGKKFSKEHIKKISEAQKGISRPYARLRKGIKMSDESRKKMSESAKGKIIKPETRLKISLYQKERLKDLSVRRQIADKLRGEKNHNWKGGTSSLNKIIRSSFEYRLWRTAVFERDNYTCVFCGLKFIKGITGNIRFEADHIKPFSLYPELRFAIDNGRTLCKKCHLTTDTFGGKIRKIK